MATRNIIQGNDQKVIFQSVLSNLMNVIIFSCIEVGLAFRRLNILPEELAVLKIIVFCECGKNESASPEAIRMLEGFLLLYEYGHLYVFLQTSKTEYSSTYSSFIGRITLIIMKVALFLINY